MAKRMPYFSRETTSFLKGIALVMMYVHHFFTFPSFWPAGVQYPLLEQLAPYLGRPMKLCVPLFCFLTGYTYFFGRDKSYHYSLRKITDVLVSYWLVFLLFAIAAAACGYNYSLKGVLLELFALERPTMVFCWYIYFYIVTMLVLPLLHKGMGRNLWLDLFTTQILLRFGLKGAEMVFHEPLVHEVIGNTLQWLPVVLTGYLFACYGGFEKLDDIFPHHPGKMFLCILIFLLVPFGRNIEPVLVLPFAGHPAISLGNVLDVLITPLFVFAAVQLQQALPNGKGSGVFAWIGKYSMYMWYLHCIFFNNAQDFFKPILYAPRFPVLVLLWGLVLGGTLAWLLDKPASRINTLKSKIMF
ncbi:MAG: acyltransferase family protein [Solobacterium sp.]|nr:acyltransferase family protein [Solobacterium sp.]